MPSVEESVVALTNRSLRTIRMELEFLTDCSVITPSQLSSFLSTLPKETPVHVADQSLPAAGQSVSQLVAQSAPSAVVEQQQQQQLPLLPPPSNTTTSMNEKQGSYYAASPSQPPPPAYGAPPAAPPPLEIASALYAYTPQDTGDLAIMPNDRIAVLEHMNADWWRGRNERTKQEGIFPRNYVTVIDEKATQPPMPPPGPSSYGNVPLEVSQGGSGASTGTTQGGSKLEQQGKKFGKKMGNAAIFGAGATIGSNLVNSIF